MVNSVETGDEAEVSVTNIHENDNENKTLKITVYFCHKKNGVLKIFMT